jgi:hypothetical protein
MIAGTEARAGARRQIRQGRMHPLRLVAVRPALNLKGW